ncbi:MAG: amidohydrolase [Gammaproteobacteria bacterium]|nr:amidohydrolase [Gammaproteobacteria bacterium]
MNPPVGAIDVHTHVVPEHLPRYAGAAVPARWPAMAPAHACHRHVMIAGEVFRTVSDQCWDAGRRLADMSAMGIATQVLSPMPELLSYWLDAGDAAQLARYLNVAIAEACAARPGHFCGLGAVPLQDVTLAIAELDHAVHVLGLAGVEIGTNVNGVAIGDPRFEPFFAAAEACGAAIFVHPLKACALDRLVGPAVLEQILAFPCETGLAAASLLTGGTFVAHPGLRIAFSHGGGAFGPLAARLDHAWRVFPALREQMPEAPLQMARRFYYDSLVYDATLLAQQIALFGATQTMIGTDYPFVILDREPLARLDTLGCDAATERLLRADNARRWLGLA